MRHSTLIYRLLCALALCILAGSPAMADVPYAPQNVEARLQWQQLDSYTWGKMIFLAWDMDSDASRRPDYFTVYVAEGEKLDYTGFDVYENFYVRMNDSNGYWNGGISIPFWPGTQSYYVDATNIDGTSDPSNIVTVEVPDSVSLFFTEYPMAHIYPASGVAAINEPFMYQVGATTWSSGTIRFNLAQFDNPLPAGLAIDENTGVITWTPTEKGMYYFRIQATMPEYPGLVVNAVASINVSECGQNTTAIYGVIRDQYGNPVTSGVVSAWPAGADSGKGINRYAQIGSNGTYSLSLDAGSYILVVDGSGFEMEYYEDASTREAATPIDIACGETLSVDMTVKRIGIFVVSGRVTDQDDEGLYGASIHIFGYDLELPENLRRLRPHRYYTYSGVDGTYSIELPEGYEYMFVANYGDSTNNGTVTHQVQFFDHVGNIAEAEIFTLTADRDDVDFQFGHNHNYDNSISGQVKLSDNTGVQSYVIAYRVGGNNQFYVASMSNSVGMYSIANMLPGQYVVYASPSSGNLSPGYYNEDGAAVPSWDDATRVVVGAQTDATGIDIIVSEVDSSAFGGGGLNGSVRGSGGAIGKGDGEVQNGTPINAALVTLIDAEGNVTRYNFSNNNGEFALNNLPAGTYKLVVDKIGFAPYKSTIEIKESGPVELDVELQPEVATGVGETTGNNAQLRLFPNPATNNAMLSFRAGHGTARISVVNAVGTEVFSVEKQTTDGDNALLLDTRALSSGAYFVRITTGGNLYTLPLQIVR